MAMSRVPASLVAVSALFLLLPTCNAISNTTIHTLDTIQPVGIITATPQVSAGSSAPAAKTTVGSSASNSRTAPASTVSTQTSEEVADSTPSGHLAIPLEPELSTNESMYGQNSRTNYANSTPPSHETTEGPSLAENDLGRTPHRYPDIPGIPAVVAGNGSAAAQQTCILLFFQCVVIIIDIGYLFSLLTL